MKKNFFVIVFLCFFSFNLFSEIDVGVKQNFKNYEHQTEEFVKKTISDLKSQKDIYDSCVFLKKQQKNDIRLFLINEDDIILFFTDEFYRLWTNFPNVQNLQNVPIIDLIHEKSVTGGWIKDFLWNDSIVTTYVKNFVKNGKKYILGAILFLENDEDNVEELLFRAYNYYKNNDLDTTIVEINNPACSFLLGTFSIELYDSDGTCLADSYDITRVGRQSNFWIDENKEAVFPKIKQAADNEKDSGWFEAIFYQGLVKKMFVLKFLDKKSQQFFYLVSGFYPSANNEKFVLNLAKTVREKILDDKDKIIEEINSPRGYFYRARISVVILDENGHIVADSKFPFLTGKNVLEEVDNGGFFITKKILEKAKEVNDKGGWVIKYNNNAAELVYVENVKLPSENLILTVQGLTPLTSQTFSFVRTEWICKMINTNVTHDIFLILNSPNETVKGLSSDPQIYGDLFSEVYDFEGFCVVSPFDPDGLWKKMDSGLIDIIEQVKKEKVQAGWFNYDVGNIKKYFYLKLCEKSVDEKYWVLVGYNELLDFKEAT